jgi:hypothetical protein
MNDKQNYINDRTLKKENITEERANNKIDMRNRK